MAYVYSHRFILSHAGAYAEYSPPEGFVALLRGATGFAADVASGGTAHLIHRDSMATILQWVIPPPAAIEGQEGFFTDFRFVLLAGETVYTANDPSVDFSVSGFLLTLP